MSPILFVAIMKCLFSRNSMRENKQHQQQCAHIHNTPIWSFIVIDFGWVVVLPFKLPCMIISMSQIVTIFCTVCVISISFIAALCCFLFPLSVNHLRSIENYFSCVDSTTGNSKSSSMRLMRNQYETNRLQPIFTIFWNIHFFHQSSLFLEHLALLPSKLNICRNICFLTKNAHLRYVHSFHPHIWRTKLPFVECDKAIQDL